MTYDEAIAHFGTQVKLAEALRIAQPTVSQWERVVPPRYQFQLEIITDGALRADPELRIPGRPEAPEPRAA
jgi:transcriptional regulator with XRE-family HTH domain